MACGSTASRQELPVPCKEGDWVDASTLVAKLVLFGFGVLASVISCSDRRHHLVELAYALVLASASLL